MDPWLIGGAVRCRLAREFATARTVTRLRELAAENVSLARTLSYELTALKNPTAAADAVDVERNQLLESGDRLDVPVPARRNGLDADALAEEFGGI